VLQPELDHLALAPGEAGQGGVEAAEAVRTIHRAWHDARP
jgi:hypothetical protein